MNQSLVLTPLGGLGEIGMNCLALEQARDGERERLLIDCGATFPSGEDGVELLHPRFDALLDDPIALRALVLTHGHEDHIGAVPYLVQSLADRGGPPLLIVGPPYAVELTRDRLDDVGVDPSTFQLRPIVPGERVRLGGFDVEPVRVTHSIVDATALLIGTVAGTVVHSGDFKLEANPLDGQVTDEARLERAGDDGVALLLSDSTNVFQEGFAGGELPVADALERLVQGASGRVVVGLFASNVHRLRALGTIAQRTRRHLCLLGRSVRKHADASRRLGLLDWPSDLVVAPDVAANLPGKRVLYLATGTQAEPRGALARIASGDHPELRIGASDLVILSSRIIPGSERQVFAMQDALLRRGVELVTRVTHPAIHVSGHAHRGEQRRLLELVRPKAFIPVHGTYHHLLRHEALAREVGVEDTLVLLDGERAALSAEGLARHGSVTAGRVAIANRRVVELDVLRQRRELGRSGVVAVMIAWTEARKPPSVHVVGTGLVDGERALAAARGAASGFLDGERPRDATRFTEGLKRAVRHRVFDATGQRPVVEVSLSDALAGAKR